MVGLTIANFINYFYIAKLNNLMLSSLKISFPIKNDKCLNISNKWFWVMLINFKKYLFCIGLQSYFWYFCEKSQELIINENE